MPPDLVYAQSLEERWIGIKNQAFVSHQMKESRIHDWKNDKMKGLLNHSHTLRPMGPTFSAFVTLRQLYTMYKQFQSSLFFTLEEQRWPSAGCSMTYLASAPNHRLGVNMFCRPVKFYLPKRSRGHFDRSYPHYPPCHNGPTDTFLRIGRLIMQNRMLFRFTLKAPLMQQLFRLVAGRQVSIVLCWLLGIKTC